MNELDLLEAWSPPAPEPAVADARRRLDAAMSAPVQRRSASPRRRLAGRALIAACVTAALVAGAVVVGRRAVDDRIDGIRRVHVGQGALSGSGTGLPMTILVVGSDSRAFVESAADANAFGAAADTGGARSDTMILVRIDRQSSTAVWLPRDLLVGPPVAARQLNSYLSKGPQALVGAVRHALGVPVDHYVQLDFRAFTDVVDAMGGVRMEVDEPIRDVYSGLDLRGAGCTSFDGNDALAWVRSRHLEILRGGVWTDASPNADLDRIDRQQQFIDALLTQLRLRIGDDVTRATRVTDAVVGALTVDAGMTRDEIKTLVGRMVGEDATSWTLNTLPVSPSADQPGRLTSDGPTGDALFEHAKTTVTTIPPSEVTPGAALGASC